MKFSPLFLLLLLTSTIGSSRCFDIADMCGNDVYRGYPSPNGKLKAVVFERDCGATSPFSTQVSILGRDERLENVPGNAFVGSDAGSAPLTDHSTMEKFEVRWLDDDHMLIRYDARGFSRETDPKIVNNVQVRIEQIP